MRVLTDASPALCGMDEHVHVQWETWWRRPSNRRVEVFPVSVDYHDPSKGVWTGTTIVIEKSSDGQIRFSDGVAQIETEEKKDG